MNSFLRSYPEITREITCRVIFTRYPFFIPQNWRVGFDVIHESLLLLRSFNGSKVDGCHDVMFSSVQNIPVNDFMSRRRVFHMKFKGIEIAPAKVLKPNYEYGIEELKRLWAI